MFPAPDLHRAYQTYIARRGGGTSASSVLIEAMDCLISRRLDAAAEMIPGRAAAALLRELQDAGAELQQIGATERLMIYGVVTTSTAGALGLLRNWQTVARRALAAEVAA